MSRSIAGLAVLAAMVSLCACCCPSDAKPAHMSMGHAGMAGSSRYAGEADRDMCRLADTCCKKAAVCPMCGHAGCTGCSAH